jgi:hypothetical protein
MITFLIGLIMLNFFLFWTALVVIAAVLIFLRKDKKDIFEDIVSILFKHNIFYGFFSILILYVVFPFTIYWSVKYFLNKIFDENDY